MSRYPALLLLALIGCKPDLGPDDALVTSTRILAIRAEPPEAKPGSPARYTALVAGPGGTDAAAAILWRWCVAPKPLAENNVVSAACLEAPSLVAAGSGPTIAAATPGDACALFGPDTPPGGFRPRDPDVTGGYYQPLRADLPGVPSAFLLTRILCGTASASAGVASQFAGAYVPNANPHLQPIAVTVGGTSVALDTIPTGARVRLEASWPAVDAETYAYFDPASSTVRSKREAMRVAWHATAGILDAESTERAEDDSATTTDNVWTAPAAGSGTLWLALSDSRGGVDFASYRFRIAR
jgi:hypothetical protein